MEQLTVPTIMCFATTLITYLFGLLSKKFGWIESKYIPYQNAIIGILAGVIVWVTRLSDNLGTAIVMCVISAFGAGGGYDLIKKSKEG